MPVTTTLQHGLKHLLNKHGVELQYLRARYYDPATQQFLSVDPMLASTEQAYAYAAGSPTNATDPTGKVVWFVPFLVAYAIGVAANMAMDVGIDAGAAYFTGDCNYDFGTSAGNAVGNWMNYVAIPGASQVGKAAKVASKLDDVASTFASLGHYAKMAGHAQDLAKSTGKGITIIGRAQDVAKFKDKGYNILDGRAKIPWAENEQWLAEAVKRGDIIMGVSDYTRIGPGPLQGWALEQKWLYEHGYEMGPDRIFRQVR